MIRVAVLLLAALLALGPASALAQQPIPATIKGWLSRTLVSTLSYVDLPWTASRIPIALSWNSTESFGGEAVLASQFPADGGGNATTDGTGMANS